MAIHPSQRPDGPYPRERRYRRFDLQFPVHLRFSSRGTVHEAISRNVSIGGLLLQSKDSLPLHTQVSLKMEVQGPQWPRSVQLQSNGEVVRVEPLESDAGFAIAVECKQPITEMENNLRAAG